MAQKGIKKLTSAELGKQNKVLDEQREFKVTIGEAVYTLSHDVIFRQTKKNKVLDDMVEFFQEATKTINILELATPYVTLLIFKHFTSLDVSDNVDEAIDLLQVLIDLDVLNQIIVELPEDELTKVFEMVTKVVSTMSENLEDAEAEIAKLQEQVESEAVKEMIPDVN
jgi:hypothetical protein